MLDLVLEFLDDSIQSSDFHTLFVQSLIHFVLFISIVLLDIMDVLIQPFYLLVQLIPLSVPLFSFFLLPLEPFGMLSLNIIKFTVKFIDSSLMEPLHLLDLQVQILNFFALAVDGFLEVAFFFHELFHVDASILEKLSVRDVSQGGLGCMGFDLFFALTDDILVLSLDSVVISSELSQSKFIVSSLVKSILNFTGKFLSRISQLVSQLLTLI